MTKVVFSKFFKPESLKDRLTAPQYLRLASTSLGNTISVETFELQPHKGRYVLQTAQSRNVSAIASTLTVAMVLAVMAVIIQSFIDPTGNSLNGVIPVWLRSTSKQDGTSGHAAQDQRHGAVMNGADSPVVKTSQRIADLLHLHLPHALSQSSDDIPPSSQKALIIHDIEDSGELSTEIHDDHETVLKHHAEAKKWDDLSKDEKKLWSKKLQDAGVWAVGEGEVRVSHVQSAQTLILDKQTVLKSIFFGQIGGLVGQVAQGVLG